MIKSEAQAVLDKVIGQVFGYKNPLTLDQFMAKFAFDVRLPQPVTDAVDGSTTWAQSTNPVKFMKLENARNIPEALRPARQLNSIDDVMAAWNEINYTTTEKYKDSLNIHESDNIYYSENIYRSQDVRTSKNCLFSDGLTGCEFVVSGQRTGDSTFCIRIEDSGECSNSFGVSWSARITNGFFIHDAADMQDSMFCTNIKGQKFCVANMQYTEEEYKRLKEMVLRWILTS